MKVIEINNPCCPTGSKISFSGTVSHSFCYNHLSNICSFQQTYTQEKTKSWRTTISSGGAEASKHSHYFCLASLSRWAWWLPMKHCRKPRVRLTAVWCRQQPLDSWLCLRSCLPSTTAIWGQQRWKLMLMVISNSWWEEGDSEYQF